MDASQSISILHKGAPKVRIKRNPAIVLLYLQGIKHTRQHKIKIQCSLSSIKEEQRLQLMCFCVYFICKTPAHRHSSKNLCEFYQWIMSNPSNISFLPSATNELKMINTINKGKRIFPLFPKECGSLASSNVFLYAAKFPKWAILLPASFVILP